MVVVLVVVAVVEDTVLVELEVVVLEVVELDVVELDVVVELVVELVLVVLLELDEDELEDELLELEDDEVVVVEGGGSSSGGGCSPPSVRSSLGRSRVGPCCCPRSRVMVGPRILEKEMESSGANSTKRTNQSAPQRKMVHVFCRYCMGLLSGNGFRPLKGLGFVTTRILCFNSTFD